MTHRAGREFQCLLAPCIIIASLSQYPEQRGRRPRLQRRPSSDPTEPSNSILQACDIPSKLVGLLTRYIARTTLAR
jgi:hypothetical protein